MKIVKVLLVIAIITTCVVGMTFAGAGGGGGRGGGGGGAGFGGGGGGGGMGGGMGMGGGGMMRGGRGRGPAATVAAMADLNLTQAQIDKLNAIPAADANLARNITTAQTALTAAVIAGEDAKIKAAVQGVASATEKQAMAQAAEYKQIKAILTPEQVKTMTTTLTAPRGGGTRRGAGGPGGGGPGGGGPRGGGGGGFGG